MAKFDTDKVFGNVGGLTRRVNGKTASVGKMKGALKAKVSPKAAGSIASSGGVFGQILRKAERAGLIAKAGRGAQAAGTAGSSGGLIAKAARKAQAAKRAGTSRKLGNGAIGRVVRKAQAAKKGK